MPVLRHTTPCKACPFRRTALPGYLGNSTPEDFIQATMGENHMPCHCTVNYETHDWKGQLPNASLCAGALIFLRNTCKRPRNEELRDATNEVEQDHATVFTWSQEFLDHHKSGDFNSKV